MNEDIEVDKSRLSPKILSRVDITDGVRHSTTGKKEVGAPTITSTAKKIE
jgi:hypothetical protein